MYTYHSGSTYGLFSGTLTPTKTGTWTLNASGGSLSINYGIGITVQSGPPANGTLTPAAVVVYKAGSNVISASSITDAYGNACTGTYAMTESYVGTYSGFSASNLNITISNGSGTAITSAFNQVYGIITYHLGSAQCSFCVWMNPNYTIGATFSSGYAISNSSNHVNSWGNNSHGELGNETTNNSSSPVQVYGSNNSIAIAGGTEAVYNLFESNGTGMVAAWGNNNYGQLGNGTINNSYSPYMISNFNNIVAIAGGGNTGYALKSDGTVWAWGYGAYGQLGNGSTTNAQTNPVQVSGLTNIISIAGIGNTGYALKSDGTVWAWGFGTHGEIGNGSTSSSQTTPVQVSGLTNIVAIAGGGDTGYALDSSGHVWSWGYGGYGQLGNGTTTYAQTTPVQVSGLTNIIAIAGGQGAGTGYALKSDGTVWAWGNGGYGQLGNGTTTTVQTIPVETSYLSNIVAIVGGGNTCYALKSDGTIWAWGFGNDGELGNGTITYVQDTPVQVTQSGWTAALP